MKISFARIIREAPAQESAIQGIQKEAKETVEQIHQSLLNIAEVKNDEELRKKIQTQVQTIGNDLKTRSDALIAEAKVQSDKLQPFIKQLQDTVQQATTDIQARHPELNIEQLRVSDCL